MSSFVEVDKETVFVGVDIGGGHVGVCVINSSCSLLSSREENNTQEEIDSSVDMIEKISRIIRTVLEEYKDKSTLHAIGIGCPGQPEDGVLKAASSFPNWADVPFVDVFSKKFEVPVTLVNDVDAALAAEYWGQPTLYANIPHAAMIAIGTGVGYAVIIDGKQHLGHFGMLEGGHIIVNPSSDVACGCGQYGCLEAFTSAKNAAIRYGKKFYAENPCPAEEQKQFTCKDVFDRAKKGEKLALAVVDEVCDYLAIFAINISRMIDPEVIIFGGGMAKAGGFLLSKIQSHFDKRTWTVLPSKVKLCIAKSHEKAGMIGAAVAASKIA